MDLVTDEDESDEESEEDFELSEKKQRFLHTAILACYLANEVASMVSLVTAVENKEMVAPMYQPLLTPVY